MSPDDFGVDESIQEGGPQKENFEENPDEYVPEAARREIVKPIFPNKKMKSPNAILAEEERKRKELAHRKYKNKQARIARRKNRK